MIATLVEGKDLWQTVVASVVAGIGVTFLFSLGIWGSGQFLELSRNDRQVAATAAGLVAALAFVAVAAAVIIGIVVMTHK
jgi:predicted small integral membrane protein